MINYILLFLIALLFIADVIIACEDLSGTEFKFVRRLRLHAYDVTPALYVTFILIILLIGLIADDDNTTGIIAAEILLAAGCFAAYIGRLLSLRKKRKKEKKLVPLPINVRKTAKLLPKAAILPKSPEASELVPKEIDI